MIARRHLPAFWAAIVVIVLAAVVIGPRLLKKPSAGAAPDFVALVLAGRAALENAEAQPAIDAFQKAIAIDATQPDVHLNLANALLLGNQSEQALARAEEVLKLDKNSAAALYVAGCAHLRLGRAAEALKALQQSEFIDASVSAVHFQIGRACQALGNWEEAANAFGATINLEPEHPAAHYALSQVLVQLNQPQAAQDEIKRHQEIIAKRPDLPSDPTFFEKCRHTKARLPTIEPEQPAASGVEVKFVDATSGSGLVGDVRGPVSLLELQPANRQALFVANYHGAPAILPVVNGPLGDDAIRLNAESAGCRACVVADLNNDRWQDVLLLYDRRAKLFAASAQGTFSDVTDPSGLAGLTATHVVPADLDFTGKLGLITVHDGALAFFRNQGNFVFRPLPTASMVSEPPIDVRHVGVDDWNGDDLPDLFLARASAPSQIWLNQHGGALRLASPATERLSPTADVQKNAGDPPVSSRWPAGDLIAVGELDGDLRHDAVIANAASIHLSFGGTAATASLAVDDLALKQIRLVDYDNDGWLDIVAAGNGLRAWRNLGRTQFRETTAELGLDTHGRTAVTSLIAGDLDADGDSDLLVDRGPAGLQVLRNDGGHANRRLLVRLIGKRSNTNGYGARIEIIAGGSRASRTVGERPLAIGIGQRSRIDSFSVHWTDLVMNLGALAPDPKTPLEITELEFPTGSCPYLYVWDGSRFRFVTDLLGASPAGLRLTDDRFIEADTDEIVHVGGEAKVKPREGSYTFQITSELREITFLDQVKLLIADHPSGTEVVSTSKLRPGKPFPPHELVLLENRRPLRHAVRSDGTEVTSVLAENDGAVVSPIRTRIPQLRGLAEPFSLTLDFGPLTVDRPLALALTGWLRFGGGMANVAASHDPTLPFPFPSLEVETGGQWRPVDVVCGAPAGKTKTILVDLGGRLPVGASRLRLGMAFEIHWDRIALFERAVGGPTTATLAPATAHLHWHGTGACEDTPWTVPVTPIYDKLQPESPWLIRPSGWCTRYGEVNELLLQRDDALAILNCGDEVTVTFPASLLPPKEASHEREFFLFSSGWDKDADYHVEHGLTVEPLPFQGMDDQLYGRTPRPVIDGDWWIPKFNTRWVGPLTLRQLPASKR